MTAAIVIDASAAVEIIARTETGVRLQGLIPVGAAPWVPDGLFDAEVLAVLRRWDRASLRTSRPDHLDGLSRSRPRTCCGTHAASGSSLVGTIVAR